MPVILTFLRTIILVFAFTVQIIAPTMADNSPESSSNSPPFNTYKAYELAMQANGATAPPKIGVEALRLSRKLVDDQDDLSVVNLELLRVAHALGGFVANKNPDKLKNVRLFTEQEILPLLFRNFESFRDIFAISIADTFTLDEITEMSKENIGTKSLNPGKSTGAADKFDKASMVLGGWLLATMSDPTNNRLKVYGLTDGH